MTQSNIVDKAATAPFVVAAFPMFMFDRHYPIINLALIATERHDLFKIDKKPECLVTGT